MRNRRYAAAGAVVAAVLVVSGCGSGQASSPQDGTVQPAGNGSPAAPGYSGGYGDGGSDSTEQAGRSTDRGGPAGVLTLREDAELGEVVADDKGWTLYRFDKDSADPPASNCDGDCAAAWPPVPADDAGAASGMDPELLGSVERSDGSTQLTLGGRPVYRYAKDTEPGDTKGHGVGGTWSALAADGKKAGQDGGAADEPAGNGDAAPARLSLADDPGLGEIVVDAQGRTLYRFDKDSAWPMKTNCLGECLKTWKPAKPVDKNRIEGIDPKLITTFTRPDGTEQLSIDCRLLYWFTGDTAPGDTNGHGVGGVWHAVTKDGKKAK
ncbi:SCO0930 family lipoprotein [Streptomyces macrosporus]|uniref:SCO0930 family lipoprotein n=1 Tax=Streptomyces macrosporus TaxID=44032 RepID=A0ABN3JS94_9ACTN